MSKEITVELNSPILVSDKGDEVEMTFIKMSEPTGKISCLCANVKSAFYQAIDKISKDEDKDEESKDDEHDLTGSDMMQMLYVSGIDMGKVIINAQMIIKATGLIGGEKAVTQPMIDRMSPNDIEKCLGEYMVNFIVRSDLQQMKKG